MINDEVSSVLAGNDDCLRWKSVVTSRALALANQSVPAVLVILAMH